MSAIENLFGSSAVEYTESGGYDQKAALLECISSGDAERIEGVVKHYIEHLRDFVQDDMGCARDAMYFVWAQFNLAATRASMWPVTYIRDTTAGLRARKTPKKSLQCAGSTRLICAKPFPMYAGNWDTASL